MGGSESTPYVPEAGSDEQVQPYDTGRKRETSSTGQPHFGEVDPYGPGTGSQVPSYGPPRAVSPPYDAGRWNYPTYVPPRVGEMYAQGTVGREMSGTGGPPSVGRPWETPSTVGPPSAGRPPSTGRPWETPSTVGPPSAGRPPSTGEPPTNERPWVIPSSGGPPSAGRPWEITGTGGPHSTGRPWETPSSGGPPSSGRSSRADRPWEIPSSGAQLSSGEPPSAGRPQSVGRPWEISSVRAPVPLSTGRKREIPSPGRPWETPSTVGPPSAGRPPSTGEPPTNERPWVIPSSGGPPSAGRPWEITGTGGPHSTGRPWETPSSGGPPSSGRSSRADRPWEIPSSGAQLSSGEPPSAGRPQSVGRPWEISSVRAPVPPSTGRKREIPSPGRPWETPSTGGPPSAGRPWEIPSARVPPRTGRSSGIPGTGGSTSDRVPQSSKSGIKRETPRARHSREKKTIEGQIDDAKSRLSQKMAVIEDRIKSVKTRPDSRFRIDEFERKMSTAKTHFLQGVQKVQKDRDETFARLLRKIEETEIQQSATSRMNWEELDDLIVRMIMFYSEFLSELEDLEEQLKREQARFSESSKSTQSTVPVARPSSSSSSQERSKQPSSPSGYGETGITIDENGGVFDLSRNGLFLEVPQNTVNQPVNVKCTVRPKDFLPSPAGKMETIVSYIVGLGPNNVYLRQPIIISLMHSGPGREYGYESIVKAFNQEQLLWEELKEYKMDSTAAKYCKTDNIQVRISKLTVLAVVSRLITDRFKVTSRGGVVRSSACKDITVQFPEGAVTRNLQGSIQVLMMPKSICTTGYPCPMLFVNGLEGINFQNYVTVRMPHPCPAKYPIGQIRLMCLKNNQWKEITDQTNRVICVEQDSFIELHVQHFSGLWPWLQAVPSNFIELFQRLCRSPQTVCFAAFREQPILSPKITLLCVANHDEGRMEKMRNDGYTRLARSTALRKMRPNDKAYLKIDGNYEQEEWTDRDFFLQFLENEPCIKELNVRRIQGSREGISQEYVILSFYPNKEENEDYLYCRLALGEKSMWQCDGIYSIRSSSSLEGGFADLSVERFNEADSDEEGDEGHNTQSNEIVSSFGAQEQLLTIRAEEVSARLPSFLNVQRTTLQDPPQHVMKKCRKFCRMLKDIGRMDIVVELRKVLPAGMTGPLSDGNILVKDMDFNRKTILTRHLSVTEKWKPLAEELKVSSVDIAFFEARTHNHSMAILDHYGSHLTVNQLYKLLVKIDANAIADHL